VIRASEVFFTVALALVLALGAGGAPALAGAPRLRTVYSSNGAWNTAGSLDAMLGYRNRTTGTGGLRLMWSASAGSFRFDAATHLAFSQGDNVAYATALAAVLPPAGPTTLFDLTRRWQSNANTSVTNRIDRLSIGFSSDNLVLKIGRQAITWGSGMVFRPADIVSPFAPNTIDTAYKPGADMIYGQFLFENGADIQAIAVPRATALGGPVAFGASTTALRLHGTLGALDANLMLARDHGDTVATLGLGGALGGASWNAEYVDWALASGARVPSWLVNISNFGQLWGRNVSYFGEVYHNGFGVGGATALSALPASLSKRMSAGQVFFAGRDFLALGMNMELSADATLAPNAIVSLNDHSVLAGVTFNYALGDNTNIRFNYTQPIGVVRTEFGGRESAPGSGVFARPARALTVQLIRFF